MLDSAKIRVCFVVDTDRRSGRNSCQLLVSRVDQNFGIFGNTQPWFANTGPRAAKVSLLIMPGALPWF
jgi:hypothetical protein